MNDSLERALREWVEFVELPVVDSSETIRLSSESVTVHRVTDFGSEWLWYITCDSLNHPEQGRWAWTGLATTTGPGRWSARGISGGAGHPLLKGTPWVNLGAHLLEHGFRAGGWVEEAGRQISAVRLIEPSGVTTEDHVENQVVLFRLDRPVTLPLRVQLIDAAGAVAATHQFP